jgi:hypothetical protein
MKGGQIILNTYSPEEIVELIKPLIVDAIREALQEKEEKLLSPAEVCKLFVPTISKTTLASWTKKGFLNEHRIGGRVYYKLSELAHLKRDINKYSMENNLK